MCVVSRMIFVIVLVTIVWLAVARNGLKDRNV